MLSRIMVYPGVGEVRIHTIVPDVVPTLSKWKHYVVFGATVDYRQELEAFVLGSKHLLSQSHELVCMLHA